ncbi:unnamed protein product, partial [Effrenium voratum]
VLPTTVWDHRSGARFLVGGLAASSDLQELRKHNVRLVIVCLDHMPRHQLDKNIQRI